MAFEKEGIDPRGFLFSTLLVLPLIAATNIDCNGRPFHCVNSTYFMICVDLGGELSSTIDDVILPCPEPTICDTNNRFECEFPPVNASTQLGSLHATNATAIESGVTTETTLTTVSTTWDATLSEATINTLSPTTSNGFRNATNIDVNNSPIDLNNTTLLSVETTTDMFTIEITNTPTSNDILNITNTIVTESKITSDFINATDLPSKIFTDLWTESIMSTVAPTASTDNLDLSNSNTHEHIMTTNLNMTSTMPPEVTSKILNEGIANTVATTTITTTNNFNVTTDSVNVPDLPLTTRNDAWTNTVIATVSPTSGNDLATSNTVYTVVTTDPNITSTMPSEVTTEILNEGIVSTVATTTNNVLSTTITTTNNFNVTTDTVNVTDLLLTTSNDAWTDTVIATVSPTSGNDLSTLNTGDAVVTTNPNITLTMPPEVTTEILNEGIVSTVATTTNNVLSTTITTTNNFNVTADSVNVTDLPLTTPNDAWTNTAIATVSPTSGNDLATSNIVDTVVTTDPNVTSTMPSEVTTEILNEKTASTVPTATNNVLSTTITTLNNFNVTTDSINTTDSSLKTPNDAWTKPAIATVSPTSGNDLSTSNTVDAVVTTNPNITSTMPPEVTTEILNEGVVSTVATTTNNVLSTTITTTNNFNVTTDTVNVTDLLLTTSNDAWTDTVISTVSPTSGNDLATSNIVDTVVTTDPNVTSTMPSEVTTEILNEKTASTVPTATNNVLSTTITTLNNFNVTTDSINTTDSSLKTPNDAWTKPAITTVSPIPGNDLATSNTVDAVVTTNPNITSTMPPEVTTEILNEGIVSTVATTTNNVLSTTITTTNNFNVTIDSVNVTDLPLTTPNDAWTNTAIATVSPTSGNDLATSNIVDTVVTTDLNVTSTMPPGVITEILNEKTASTVPTATNNVLSTTITTTNNFNVTTDTVNVTDLLLTTSNDAWTKPAIATVSPTSGNDLSTSNTVDAVVTTNPNITSTMPPEVTTEILNEGIVSTVATTTNNVLSTTITTTNNFNVTTDTVNVTDLLLTTSNDAWTDTVITTVSLTSGNDLATSNTVDTVVTTDPNITSTMPSEVTTEIMNERTASTVPTATNNVLSTTITTTNNFNVTTDSVNVTDLPLTTPNDAWTKPVITMTTPTSGNNLPPSNTVELVLATDSNVTSALVPEATTETSIKEIESTLVPTTRDVSNATIATVNDPKLTTDAVKATDLPLTTTHDAWTKSIITTVKPTISDDNLSTSNTVAVDAIVITDINVTSAMPLEVTTEILNERVASAVATRSSDILNTTITITPNDFINTTDLPLKTINASMKSIISTISPYRTGHLITSSDYLHLVDKNTETTDSYITSLLPPKTSMPLATEILLSTENTTSNSFIVNATKNLFTVKPEAVTLVYRESQANPIEENSRTVSINDSDNNDIITTTSMYVEEFTNINQKSIPTEPNNHNILTTPNSLKQYNTETGFITEFHKSTVDPGIIKTISGSTTASQYISSIEKRSNLPDKLPIPYLPLTSAPNNKVDTTTKTDYEKFNKSDYRSIPVNVSTSTLLVTTDNPHIKMATKHELNMTTNNSTHMNNHNEKSMLNIYDSVDSGVTLRGNNRSNINVSTNYNTENNRKQTRNVNDITTTPAKIWNDTPKILKSDGNINSVNFDCIYHNRGRYADNNDCRKFYICIGRRQPIAGTCPINTVFSEIWKQCTKNLSHCVRNNQFRCTSEGRFGDILQDKVYYICVQNDANSFYRIKLQCQNGYHLNKTIIKCIPNANEASQSISIDTDSSKTSDISTTVTDESEKSMKLEFECTEEGVYADPNDCRRYYLCTKNKSQYRRKKKKCDSDEVFHKEKKKCVNADSYEC